MRVSILNILIFYYQVLFRHPLEAFLRCGEGIPSGTLKVFSEQKCGEVWVMEAI